MMDVEKIIEENRDVNENDTFQTKDRTYLSEIITVLKELGGEGSLSQIYSMIKKRNKLPYIHTNPAWERQVSSEIQRHSSDTKSFIEGNDDLFYSVDGIRKGIWGLRDYNSDIKTEIVDQTNIDETGNSYTKQDFLDEVFMTEPQYDTILSLLRCKKNIILQGAPGVGKTFTAKRLAYSIMGERDDSRIRFVQFHQSYSYEDFIMGYRPNENGGFELKNGIFYEFCNRARRDSGRDYFFIIDEINRGNLSKIFGELLMLIEKDYRGQKAVLSYSGEEFSVPGNLYIIGMMNTADRSLAMIDYALRRRFGFYTIPPAFENAQENGFDDLMDGTGCELYRNVVAKIRELNDAIRKDNALGQGFEIGHSYFVPQDFSAIDDAWVRNVVRFEIIPLIEEYWFDDEKKCSHWKEELCQAIGEKYDV